MLSSHTQVSELRKSFANNFWANIRLSKAQFHKIVQSQGYLGGLLGRPLKTGLPVIENVLKALAKSIWIPLGLTAATSATDASIHNKMFGSGFTKLIISN